MDHGLLFGDIGGTVLGGELRCLGKPMQACHNRVIGHVEAERGTNAAAT